MLFGGGRRGKGGRSGWSTWWSVGEYRAGESVALLGIYAKKSGGNSCSLFICAYFADIRTAKGNLGLRDPPRTRASATPTDYGYVNFSAYRVLVVGGWLSCRLFGHACTELSDP